MKAISVWILSILAVVILGTVIDLLLTGNKLHKFIRSVFATITVLIVLTPIPSLIKNGFQTDGGFIFDTEIPLDDRYLQYINKQKVAVMERGVVSALDGDGVHGAEVTIEADVSSEIVIEKVTVNLKKVVIDENLSHIDKYELVTGFVTKYLSIKKDIVFINE